ncbi:MAG: 16S rRNA (cytosine(1402)-N(4))-methyltransferase RsmH [Bacteroidetes bacterium]|jgi:16S rRNA (cytosine1402-N4)-methyltransferase|nr:16S rRNA (cytosine(1402)-N(4))-methyltransferase RsmH [Bacteroidota bacterium]
MMMYHEPVMLEECIEGLALDPNGVYVDATVGGGGHARRILEVLDDGVLIGFDQDSDAENEIQNEGRLVFVPSNFRYLDYWLKYLGYGKVDGVLADFGVSSHQLNEPERGFAFKFNSTLDMRMNREGEKTVSQLLNESTESELQSIFSEYGEIRNAKTLAETIADRRWGKKEYQVRDLNQMIDACVRGNKQRYFAQVYQSLRIAVNDEMGALEFFLLSLNDWVKPGGRLVALSYHSLEDRRVKNLIKKGHPRGEIQEDEFGKKRKYWKEKIKGVQTPTSEEIKKNSRARSAKLRIAERIDTI